MAFLCPVRIRTKNKTPATAPPGRITGSSSVETLVAVGKAPSPSTPQNPPSPTHLVLHNFSPCVDDELPVTAGDRVKLLYRENDWAYVLNEEQKEGFIPFTYLAEIKEENFPKSSHGKYVVLYGFKAKDENDVSVSRGQIVSVLNKDDPDWFWVEKYDGTEGFIPSAFTFPYNYIEQGAREWKSSKEQTELVMLYDYKAQAPDDLTVKRGDWIYADLSCQSVEGWFWVWSQRGKKYGFVPSAYCRVNAMTSL